MGVLRYSPSSFWSCTLDEILTAVEYYNELDVARNKQAWERARFITQILLQPHAKKGQKIKAEDIVQFAWEVPDSSEVSSQERIEHLRKYAEENSYLSF